MMTSCSWRPRRPVLARSFHKAASGEKEWLRRYDCVFGSANCERNYMPADHVGWTDEKSHCRGYRSQHLLEFHVSRWHSKADAAHQGTPLAETAGQRLKLKMAGNESLDQAELREPQDSATSPNRKSLRLNVRCGPSCHTRGAKVC